MMLKMSRHASQDRIERFVYIVTEIGIGEPLVTVMHEGRPITLTDNGIVIVFSDNTRTEVLTAYLASNDRVIAIWNEAKEQLHYTFNRSYYFRKIEQINKVHRKAIDKLNLFYGYV